MSAAIADGLTLFGARRSQGTGVTRSGSYSHDDVIKWKHFPRYWPFVRGIHRVSVNSHTKASDAEL